jgi:mRNA-degrading endonuclease RelE of RelBE toxin-antitoxin system
MKTEIIIEENPLAFIRRQPPQTRKNIRAVIHALERGDYLIEPLENELDGFYKVKIEDLRLIVQATTGLCGPVLKVVFAQRRDTVYDEFKIILGV